MTIKNIIKESLEKKPMAIKEALDVELKSRVARAISEKMETFNEAKSPKIACTKCDDVATEKAWEKNGGSCPCCNSSTKGVKESLDEVFASDYSGTLGPFKKAVEKAEDAHKRGLPDKKKTYIDSARNRLMGMKNSDISKLKDTDHYDRYKALTEAGGISGHDDPIVSLKGVKHAVTRETAKYVELLRHHDGKKVTYTDDDNEFHSVKRQLDSMHEETLDEISKKTLVNYMDKSKKDTTDLNKKYKKGTLTTDDENKFDRRLRGQNIAMNKFHGKAKVPASGIDRAYTMAQLALRKEHLDEAKESPITGTRKISTHQGATYGHHAEVRYNPEWEEYSVHHYKDGKHLGEGPVSYHGSGKEGRADATDTAEYEAKNYRVLGDKLVKN